MQDFVFVIHCHISYLLQILFSLLTTKVSHWILADISECKGCYSHPPKIVRQLRGDYNKLPKGTVYRGDNLITFLQFRQLHFFLHTLKSHCKASKHLVSKSCVVFVLKQSIDGEPVKIDISLALG